MPIEEVHLLHVDWLLTFANHREHFATAVKDKRIRFVSPDEVPHWTEIIIDEFPDDESDQ